MVPPSTKKRNAQRAKRRKADSRKIVGRITYNPAQHKQKKVRALREKLQERDVHEVLPAPSPPETIKFGSFNVNGLDLEAAWAVERLLKDRGFDVKKKSMKNSFKK